MTATRVELIDEQDLAFAKVAQGSMVNNTVLPSGLKTPAQNMLIEGNALIATATTAEEFRRKNVMRRGHESNRRRNHYDPK